MSGSGLVELFGETLMNSEGVLKSTSELLGGKKAIAIYFSAHWCPPCRGFTPQLAEWYRKNLKAKGLEIVFVSSDRDEASFSEYFKEQPWVALAFEARDKKNELSKKFKVQGIPSLVILDSEGKTITTDGKSAIAGDPTGEDFPWKPVPPKKLLEAAKIVNAEGDAFTVEEVLKDKKALALYFSAHWCPPCRGFTPQLAKWYTEHLKAKGLEVVFLSSDRDENSFKEYFKEMPWLALDYSDRKLKEKLSDAFGVSGIPSLVILDADLNLVTKEGRNAVALDKEGNEMPWYPKPVANLKQGPGDINETPTVLAFVETNDDATKKAVEDALTTVSVKYGEKAKAAGEEKEFAFTIATENEGLCGQLRSMTKLPQLPPAHEHPLLEKPPGGGWGCDGCGKDGAESKTRFRCCEGCDYDLCDDCYAKMGTEAKPQPPRLCLMDIPDNGGYYLAPESFQITAESLEAFLGDYKAGGKLERQQLGD